MVKKAVEHGADCGRIAQQLTPVFHRTLRSHQRAGSLVAAHNDFEQLFGRCQGQLAHAEIIEDEQEHGHQRFQAFFARAIQSGLSELIEQGAP